MLFYLTVDEVPLVLGINLKEEEGASILTIQEILGNENMYSAFKSTFKGTSLIKVGKKERPALTIDKDNPFIKDMGGKCVDFTPFLGVINQLLEAGDKTVDEVYQMVADAFNATSEQIGEEPIFNNDLVMALVNTCTKLMSYVEGTTSFPVVLDEIDRVGFEDNIVEANESAVLTGRSRLYTNNRVNVGSVMRTPTDTFYFRVPGPRAIFENSGDFAALKPDMLSLYTKDHIESVKSYPRAFNNMDLRGSAVNVDAPIASYEQNMYTALCQMMADSIRLPKTDFVYASDELEEAIEEGLDEEDIMNADDATGSKVKIDLPPGKMYSCQTGEIIDMSDDDDYMVTHGKLDKEVEDFMMFLVKTIGSWNWAYSGCFPHAEGYSEVAIDAHGGVTFIQPNKVSLMFTEEEDLISSYDIQDPIVVNHYAKMGGMDITSRQNVVDRYIKTCYQEFGPKVFAEAIVKLGRWGNRRPNKLHLGNSNKYLNLMSGTLDSKSGDITSMKIKEVNGRQFELGNIIMADTGYKDKLMCAGENKLRDVVGFPVGIVAKTTYYSEKDPENIDYRWTFMSILDIVLSFLTGNEKDLPAYINMSGDCKFIIDRSFLKDSKALSEDIQLSEVPSFIEYSIDGENVAYNSEQLSLLLLLNNVNQNNFSHLQCYQNVKSEPVISNEVNKFIEPRIDKIPNYIRENGLSMSENLGKYMNIYIHNLFDEFLLPCVEKYYAEVLDNVDLKSSNNSLLIATGMYGPSSTALDINVSAFMLEYFLNAMAEQVIKMNYHGEVSYCTGDDFINSYQVKIPSYVINVDTNNTQPQSQVSNQSSSTKMNLTGTQEVGKAVLSSMNSAPVFRPIPEGSVAQPLRFKLSEENFVYVAPIYLGQDEFGAYGVITANRGPIPSQSPVTVTKAWFTRFIFDTLLFDIDEGHQIAQFFGKSVNRLYFEDLEAALYCRKVLHAK